jgi:hypothetical protein
MLGKMDRPLLAAAFLLFALPASAQVVTFEFCGRSIYGTPMAPVGTPVSGRFSWDIAAPALEPSGSVDNNYYAPQVGRFAFVVGEHNVATDNMWVIVRNYPGSGDSIDINGYAPVIDGTLFSQGYFGIRLSATPGSDVFADGKLPRDLNLADFNNPSYGYFQMYSGVVSNDIMLDVELQWLGHPQDRPGNSERRDCHPLPRR